MEHTKIKKRARAGRLLLHTMIKTKQCFIVFKKMSKKIEFEAKTVGG